MTTRLKLIAIRIQQWMLERKIARCERGIEKWKKNREVAMAANYAKHPHARQMYEACSVSDFDALVELKKSMHKELSKLIYRRWLLVTPTHELVSERDRMMKQWGEIFRA